MPFHNKFSTAKLQVLAVERGAPELNDLPAHSASKGANENSRSL